jgi:hypothetical protein
MLKKIKILVILFGIMFFQSSFAYEVIEVCVTYKNTSKNYNVEVRVFDGNELNQRTKSFSYENFSKYAIIFWAEGQATIIKLDSFFKIGPFGSNGTDQNGYPWELTTSKFLCN